MKGHSRKHRETGGVNEAEEDERDRPEPRTDAKKIDSEAEELKKGGRAKRKRGGRAEMRVEGHEPAHHAGRKPRKSAGRAAEHEREGEEKHEKREREDREHEREGEERRHRATGGRTSGSDGHPFTSARKGQDAPGRKLMKGELGFGED